LDSGILLLLVDDERLIVGLLRESLEEGGFTVETAASANEAFDSLDRRNGRLAGLITDVNLGGSRTGWDVARRARELRPDLPVDYTSGFAADDWAMEGVPKSIMVPKPYAPAQVVTAISTLINKSASEVPAKK
jgi:DNA-binding response OmpR family regulator